MRAISCGVTYLGFSDHFSHISSGGYESNYRVSVSEFKGYFKEINHLREKCKDKIDIKIGFETEYYLLYFPYEGWSEQNSCDWVEKSLDGLSELLDGCDKNSVAGISIGGQMHDRKKRSLIRGCGGQIKSSWQER